MPPLAAIVHKHWLAAQREPVAALAFHANSSECQLLETYREALTAHDVLPPRTNLVIVFQSDLPLVPHARLISITRQHSAHLIVVIVNQASVQFHAVGWYISPVDLETVDLSADLPLPTEARSGEAYAVVLASVVALALLVIIAVSLLPAAPALT